MGKNIAYLGNFYKCIEGIIRNYNLFLVISEKGKENSRIRRFCRKKRISYRTVESVKDISDAVKKFEDLDLIVIGSFSLILPDEIFSRPRFGAINVHPGYLPLYRGRHPLPWALYNREKEVGVAVHAVERRVDMGPIIERSKISVDYSRSYKEIEKRLLKLIPDMLDKSLNRVFAGDSDFIKQNEDDSLYFPPMAVKPLTRILNAQVLEEDLPKNEKDSY